MLVTKLNIKNVADQLRYEKSLALDTETTGLRPYQGDRLFSMVISSDKENYYFNFKSYGLGAPVLDYADLTEELWHLWMQPHIIWYMHNAKFDLAMLANEGVEIAGTIHCTEVGARLLKNDLMIYSLGSLALSIGMEKSKAVDEYIKKNKLYTIVQIPGKKKKTKNLHFDQVPFDIISEYAMQDGKVTFVLGEKERLKLAELDARHREKNFFIGKVYANELSVTKTCLAMEAAGVKIDRDYVSAAADYESSLADEAAKKFEDLSGAPFKDSNKVLEKAFKAAGEPISYTEKKNASFTDELLEGMTTPLAKCLQDYRSASKKAQTYYRNFLYYADENGVIHPNMRQAGTATGRFSYSDPNLQNLPKEEDAKLKFIVRRSFVPRDGFCFVMIDYKQMEYRLMLEYAVERGIIKNVQDGLDVHEATANLMGVSRSEAKTLNFMLLYGGGVGKLAKSLGLSLNHAEHLRNLYFSKLPRIQAFVQKAIEATKKNGYVHNWLGRIYYIDYDFAYKAPNYLIQGGCADIVKRAMNSCHAFLGPKKSRLLLQIHDELLFEVHESELHIVDTLKILMESAYIANHLHMACDVDHSWVSWGDKIKGCPNATNKSLPRLINAPNHAQENSKNLLDLERANSAMQ